MAALPESERNFFFTKYLNASGENCDSVLRNFYQGNFKREAFWNVECQNKNSFVISVSADKNGSSKIMNCNLLKTINGGECFKKF